MGVTFQSPALSMKSNYQFINFSFSLLLGSGETGSTQGTTLHPGIFPWKLCQLSKILVPLLQLSQVLLRTIPLTKKVDTRRKGWVMEESLLWLVEEFWWQHVQHLPLQSALTDPVHRSIRCWKTAIDPCALFLSVLQPEVLLYASFKDWCIDEMHH